MRGHTWDYQALHADISRVPPELDKDIPPLVVVNFTCRPVTALNGPMRIIPRELHTPGRPPSLEEEPAEWRAMRLFPLESGTAIIRDVRLWHGGTPNWSSETRFLPNLEFYSVGYAEHSRSLVKPGFESRFSKPSLPRELFMELPEEIQALACDIVSDDYLPQTCNPKLTKPAKRFPRWETRLARMQCGDTLLASRLGISEKAQLHTVATSMEFVVEELSLTSLRITWPRDR